MVLLLATSLPPLHVTLLTIVTSPTTTGVQKGARSHTHKKWRGCWQFLCVAVVMCLLLQSGDVEINPGPFDMVPSNLAKVQNMIFGARLGWFNLGLELGLDDTTLKTVQNDYKKVDDCFTEMLSRWLRMTNPPPTWEGLIAALKQSSVSYPVIAEKVQEEYEKLDTSTVAHEPTRAEASSQVNTSYEDSSANLLKEPIEKQIKILESRFKKIAIQTYDKIEDTQMTVGRLKARLVSLPVEYKEEHKEFFQEMKKEINHCSTVDDIWEKLSEYWNYLNYTLLESFIDSLDDPHLSQKMDDYLQLLQVFLRNTLVSDFAKHCPRRKKRVVTELKDFVVHLDLDWDKCTLEEVDDKADHIMRKFHLPKFLVNLEEISSGSVLITWSLPTAMASRVRNDLENMDMSSFKKEHGILSISIDGEECKYSAIKLYSKYLKDLYAHKKGKNLASFRVAAIERERVGPSDYDKFTKSTLRGDQDDVVYCKYHIEEDVVGCPAYWNGTHHKQPRLVLIEGAPGVGKTTFSEQFCYKWSQGQRLSNHKLLVLLPLRDKSVRSAKNVSDLFQHPQLQPAIAEEVERSGGEGVALWLEAWDELEEEMRETSSLFLDLVHGRVLPKATVIITSRPWATTNIREKPVDQHIELVSTPSIQFSRVLREERVKPDSRAKFLDYINFNPSMKAAMHTPVTANIVADVFQWSRDTESPPPTTMTQLYTAFTCKLLMEHLSSHKAEGKQTRKILSLEDVPDHMMKQLMNLCRLSWEGLVRQQLIFSSDAVGGDTLGLMHGVRELYGGEDGQLSYHFIHLTLQEFLSAYHIAKLPTDAQQQVIEEHVGTGHLMMMVKFFFGLSTPNTFTASLIARHITSQQNMRSSSAYHWLFEGGNNVGKLTEALDQDTEVGVRSSYTWNPLDYYVLGHSILQCNFKWRLNFAHASMGDEVMEMLIKGMASSTETIWNGEILFACFDSNNITSNGIKLLDNIPLQILQQIRYLDLNRNKLDRNAMVSLSEVIPRLTRLQFLRLLDNPIGDGGAVEVLNSLYHHKTPLKTLNLRGTGVGEEDSKPLTQLIANNVLEILRISGDLLPSIMKCPLPNSTLQVLYMSRSPLSEEATTSLASLLLQSVLQFRVLDIWRCGVTSEGAVQLARALTNNHWLTELDMGGNRIGVKGAKAVGKMLEENRTMEVLYLNDHEDSGSLGEEVDVLISSLQKNTTLHSLTLSWEYKRPTSDSRVNWQ